MLIKTFCGLFEMIFRLVNVTFSLPEWQAVKMTFFTPWVRDISEVTWFRSPISWKKQTHSSRAAGGSSWSHSKPCCHKCCIPILAQTKRLLGIQRDEIFKQCGWLLFPKQSNVIGQVYIEQEHVFIKFQTVSSIFSYIESYSNAAFQFWRELRGCWESNWMKYSSNLADYCSLSQSNVTGQRLVWEPSLDLKSTFQ